MQFLSPIFLWFMAAAALPVMVHLINKKRHKSVKWAAMQFLLKATRQSRGKKKLRHIVILTCRALAIATLAAAAGRPIISGLTGWGGGTIDTVVLVIDRSVSMESTAGSGTPPMLESAVAKIRKTLGDLKPARVVLIDSANATPQEVPSPGDLPELSALAPTDTAADFPTLLLRAAEFLTDAQGQSEIWIASDLQASNWKPGDERWEIARAAVSSLPRKPPIRILSTTSDRPPTNFSVSLLNCRRNDSELLIDIEILRHGEARGTASIPLSATVNGATSSENLRIPGQSLRYQKRVAIPADSDTGFGWLSLPGDANLRDNAAFFAYGPNRPVNVLVVCPPGESADYLALAAAPPGLGNTTVSVIRPDEAARSLQLADTSVVIWAAPFPGFPAGPILHRFITSGGHVAFFPPGDESAFSFGDINWEAPKEAKSGKYFILKDWEHREGPLADGLDGTPIPATRLKAIRRQVPLGDATPLAVWEDGEPFLTRRVIDHGTAWYFGSLPDYTWSNLGDADVLLPALQRISIASAQRFDAAYSAHVGDPATRILAGETRERVDHHSESDPANADFEAGVFRLGDRLIAINRPVTENAPELLTSDELNTIFEGTEHTLLDQIGSSPGSELSSDVWRPFIIAALLFLLGEAILSLPPRHRVETLAPHHTAPSPTLH